MADGKGIIDKENLISLEIINIKRLEKGVLIHYRLI